MTYKINDENTCVYLLTAGLTACVALASTAKKEVGLMISHLGLGVLVRTDSEHSGEENRNKNKPKNTQQRTLSCWSESNYISQGYVSF